MSVSNSVLVAAATVAAAAFLPGVILSAPASPGSSHSQSHATTGATASAAPASTGPASRIILKDYPVPADQAYKLLPSDPGVVTNGPIPDTPSNRARYGEPLSHAGRVSAPDGN